MTGQRRIGVPIGSTKQTWTAHLPANRQAATGRLAPGEVFLVVVLDRDHNRYIRLELTVDHTRALAGDLWAAAQKADTTGTTTLHIGQGQAG
jgi:hypothetical protein